MQEIPEEGHETRSYLLDKLIDESVNQIDRQIEENVATSSIVNHQMAAAQSEERTLNLKISDQGIPDLSHISEENSIIPTDLCTSPDESFKSEDEQFSESIISQKLGFYVDFKIRHVVCQKFNDFKFFCFIFKNRKKTLKKFI